tara:strand:- start:68 stop:169 length:102 start_codon:yes stop_codon:yes gene_type:complete
MGKMKEMWIEMKTSDKIITMIFAKAGIDLFEVK